MAQSGYGDSGMSGVGFLDRWREHRRISKIISEREEIPLSSWGPNPHVQGFVASIYHDISKRHWGTNRLSPDDPYSFLVPVYGDPDADSEILESVEGWFKRPLTPDELKSIQQLPLGQAFTLLANNSLYLDVTPIEPDRPPDKNEILNELRAYLSRNLRIAPEVEIGPSLRIGELFKDQSNRYWIANYLKDRYLVALPRETRTGPPIVFYVSSVLLLLWLFKDYDPELGWSLPFFGIGGALLKIAMSLILAAIIQTVWTRLFLAFSRTTLGDIVDRIAERFGKLKH